ncbi:DUF2213 domain-containing protein [Thiolapillus sp.]|uniref:DUF2213 domain-containing protein n=1 Tax=Thiolapillus sp. TaxID=2017437 RepID=UPI003AF9CEA6
MSEMVNYRVDVGTVEKYTDQNGALRLKGRAARTGILVYRMADGSERREYVPPETLFNADSMDVMTGIPLTLNHPTAGVSPDNYNEVVAGAVVATDAQGEYLGVDVTVNARDAIDAVKSGTSQLSCGYFVTTMDMDGQIDGERYDAIQIARKYNHLAVVDCGRAGPECSLKLDYAIQVEDTMTKKADETPDPKDDKKIDQNNQKPDPKPEPNPADDSVKLQARIDALEAKLAKYEADEADKKADENLDSTVRVDPRFALINELNARNIHVDTVDKEGKPATYAGMVRDALDKMGIKNNIDGQSETYLRARLDAELAIRDRENVTPKGDGKMPKDYISPVEKFKLDQAKKYQENMS